MSYLLEALGRGLLADLRTAFENQLPNYEGDDAQRLRSRISASPGSFDLAMRLGMVCLREGQLSEARANFETARQLNPASAQAPLALACVCDEHGQLNGALEFLHEAQQRDPRDPAIAFGIA